MQIITQVYNEVSRTSSLFAICVAILVTRSISTNITKDANLTNLETNSTDLESNVTEFGIMVTTNGSDNYTEPPATSTELYGLETGPVNVIPKERLDLEDFCLCDLTTFYCDINCCCDPDCSQDDKQVFTYCKPHMTRYIEQEYCFEESVLFRNNTPYRATHVSTDLLCVLTDNLRENHFYPVIKGAKSGSDYDVIIKGTFSYTWENSFELDDKLEQTNTYGSLMYMVDEEEAIELFELPSSFASDDCFQKEEIFYLEDHSDNCKIKIIDLQNQCETEPLFSLYHYSSRNFVAWIPEEMKDNQREDPDSSQPTTVPAETKNITSNISTESVDLLTTNSSENQNLYNEGKFNIYKIFNKIPPTFHLCADISEEDSCAITEFPPTPLHQNGQCENVLEKAKFIFTHNGSYGIQEALIIFQIQTLRLESEFASQEYHVVFKKPDFNETAVFKKSGSPGYLIGKPILMGYHQYGNNSDNEEDESVYLDREPKNWLSIASMDANHRCTDRTSVTFKENIYSGCFYEVSLDKSTTTCDDFRDNVLSALIDHILNYEDTIYLGMFGDSSVQNLKEWIPLLIASELRRSSSDSDKGSEDESRRICRNIVTSVGLEISFAYQGPYHSPQAKLVAANLKPLKIIAMSLPKRLPNGSNIFKKAPRQLFLDLSTVVSFVDVTKDPEIQYPERPSFDLKLPYDFFYPFLPSPSSGERSSQATFWTVSVLLCSLNCLV